MKSFWVIRSWTRVRLVGLPCPGCPLNFVISFHPIYCTTVLRQIGSAGFAAPQDQATTQDWITHLTQYPIVTISTAILVRSLITRKREEAQGSQGKLKLFPCKKILHPRKSLVMFSCQLRVCDDDLARYAISCAEQDSFSASARLTTAENVCFFRALMLMW